MICLYNGGSVLCEVGAEAEKKVEHVARSTFIFPLTKLR